MYYTYILRCSDGSLYTGITNDLQKRMDAHSGKLPDGAKYTRSHSPERLEAVWKSRGRSEASRLEYRIKKLDKRQKQRLIEENALYLIKDIDEADYERTETPVFL